MHDKNEARLFPFPVGITYGNLESKNKCVILKSNPSYIHKPVSYMRIIIMKFLIGSGFVITGCSRMILNVSSERKCIITPLGYAFIKMP